MWRGNPYELTDPYRSPGAPPLRKRVVSGLRQADVTLEIDHIRVYDMKLLEMD